MYFTDEKHKEKFYEISDGSFDKEFLATIYLLTSIRKLHKGYYMIPRDLDYMDINYDDHGKKSRILIEIAINMYTGTTYKEYVSFSDFINLGKREFRLVMNAIDIYKNGLESDKEYCKSSEAFKKECVKSVGRPKKDISDQVKELKENGLTNKEIANQLDVSLSTVKRNI